MSDQRRGSGERLRKREVTVDEPNLSEATNRQLTEEVRDAVGSERVEFPEGRGAPSGGDAPTHRFTTLAVTLRPNRFMLTMIGASVVVVAVIIALLVGSWWVLAGAVIVLGLVTFAVVLTVLRMTSNRERPSATTVAALEEEGITDPEAHFSELVAEFTPEPDERDRRAGVDADPARTAAEPERADTRTTEPPSPPARERRHRL